MKFYNSKHKYFCGVDLHAKSMYVCVMDNDGEVKLHRNIRTDSKYFLKILQPYREDLVVAVECMFSWYWLADLCRRENIEFILGHALYMKAIHGGKAKNDKIDSKKIAGLARSGMFPIAYVYPHEMRSARDLMRRRTHFARKRAELITHTQILRIQNNMPEFGRLIRSRYGNTRDGITKNFVDPFVEKSVEMNLRTVDYYDDNLKWLEKEIKNAAKSHDIESLRILKTFPGIGDILALTILYEIHEIERFPRVQDFLSYARLVKCKKESAGKNYGSSGKKIGNAHLKWAFSESAVMMLRDDEVKKYLQKLQRKHPKGKAMSILSARIGRSVYTMLKNKRNFDMSKFLNK